MTQTERLITLYTKGWTSHKKASERGCGLYVWKRWGEWEKKHACLIGNAMDARFGYSCAGKRYQEQTRYREVKGVRFLERRLVRV